jgi:hypothetical protein
MQRLTLEQAKTYARAPLLSRYCYTVLLYIQIFPFWGASHSGELRIDNTPLTDGRFTILLMS